MSTYSGEPAAPPRSTATLPDDRFDLVGDATSAEVTGSTVVVRTGEAAIAVTLLADDLARVRVVPDGDFERWGHGAGPDETPFSYALQPGQTWDGVDAALQDNGTDWTVATPAMTVRVQKRPCRVSFETPDGRPFLQDSAGPGFTVTDDGRTEVRCWKALAPETRFFGLGDKTFELDRRGHQLTFWNADTYAYAPEQDPIYKSIPFTLTLAPTGADGAWTGAGLFFDNTYESSMDLGASSDDDWWFGSTDGELRYYVFAGPDLKTPLRRFCDLTGHKPMPAQWTARLPPEPLELPRRRLRALDRP